MFEQVMQQLLDCLIGAEDRSLTTSRVFDQEAAAAPLRWLDVDAPASREPTLQGPQSGLGA